MSFLDSFVVIDLEALAATSAGLVLSYGIGIAEGFIALVVIMVVLLIIALIGWSKYKSDGPNPVNKRKSSQLLGEGESLATHSDNVSSESADEHVERGWPTVVGGCMMLPFLVALYFLVVLIAEL